MKSKRLLARSGSGPNGRPIYTYVRLEGSVRRSSLGIADRRTRYFRSSVAVSSEQLWRRRYFTIEECGQLSGSDMARTVFSVSSPELRKAVPDAEILRRRLHFQ